jgi:two-component system, chemotaxis family, sensor kinase Cph1
LRDDAGVMRFTAWRGISNADRAAVEGHSPWPCDVREPEPIYLSDIAKPSFEPWLQSTIQQQGVGALAFLPLLAHDKLLGKLAIYYNAPHSFRTEEIQLAQAISRHLAFGLERTRAEELLQHSEAQRAAIIGQAPVGIYLVDSRMRIVEVNPTAEPVFGTLGNLIGRDLVEVMHMVWPKETADEVMTYFHRTLATGEPSIVKGFSEDRIDRDATEQYDWELHRITLPGGSYGIVTYFTDISAHVRAGKKIKETERRFRALVTASSDALYRMSPDWSEMWDLNGARFIADTNRPSRTWLEDYIPPEDQPRVRAAIEEAIRSKEMFELEHRVRRADGTLGWTFSRAAPLLNEMGEIVEWFGAASDITERKRAEEALHQAQTELAAANQLLSDRAKQLETLVEQRTAELRETVQQLETFSYSVVHDMRAPLRSMRSFAALLEAEHRDKLDENGRSYLARIISSCSRMDALITDVLSYSRIALSRVELQRVNLDQLVPEIVEQYPQFQEASGSIGIERPLPVVMGNKALLTQVFSNLLGNAVKFMPPGRAPSVRVCAEAKGERVRIWVEDNGIGIEPAYREKVFELFQRLHAPDGYSGTGVGLAIVKKAVEQMGGTVGFESEPGRGSRFWIELRLSEKQHFQIS